MSSGGKGGSAQQSHDYYGTVMGVIGVGPIGSIQLILLNGTAVFGIGFLDANGNRVGYFDSNGNPGSALVYGVGGVGEGYSLNIPGLGPVIIHWGLETAAPDAVLNKYDNHPPYKGYAYIVLNNCLFGTEQTTAPNIEFVVTSIPNQSIVTGLSAGLDANGNANAAALAAEFATAWHGLNLPASAINVASFQTVADSIRLDPLYSQGLAGISPVYKEQTDARTVFGDMQCTCDLWFGFDLNGLLMCGQWLRGGPTGALTAITANQWTVPPKDETDDITAIPTGFDVTFDDRQQLYTETSAPTNNLLATSLGAIGKRQQLRRAMLTSATQAHLMGGECLRLMGSQTVTGQVTVRANCAFNPDGTPIRPGNYFELDTQQEPGQLGQLTLCRCTGRSYDPESAITIEYEYDPGAVPTPYVVPYSNNNPIPYVVPPLNYQRTGSLPPPPGSPPTLFILALRSDPTWIGVQVYEDTIISGDFGQIGTQVGFALPTSLQAPVAATDTTITVDTIPFFAPGIPGDTDVGYLNNALGVNSDSAARNNTLLCILVRKTPGTNAQFPNGTLPWLEICSVVETTLLATGQYSVQLLRGRMGTAPLAFDTAGGAIVFPDAFSNYEAWFIPSSLLVAFGHTDFAALAASGGTAYFEFSPFTKKATYAPQNAYAAGLQPTPQWTPIWAYPFPTGYTQAPVITVTAPAPAAQTNTAGQINLTFSVADPTNSIAKITAFAAMSADGSQNTAIMAQDILNDGTFNWTGLVTLPNVEGNFTITVRVTNAYNVTSVQTVQVYRAIAVSGYPLSAPSMMPAGYPISGSAQITITKPAGSSGTSQLQSSIDGGTTWVSYPSTSNSVQVTVLPNHPLYARMTDTGPVYSFPTVNYYPNAIFGGGYLAGAQP